MSTILIVGIIVFTGFICGEIAERIGLPKVTGYITAGVLLNPSISRFIPGNFPEHTVIVTNIALAFITFSIGGTLLYSRVKELGRGIFCITVFEAEFAFLAIFAGFLAITPFFARIPGATWTSVFIPLALLAGSLGSPTDPSATLAVKQEYHPDGEVSSTMLGVAAFDDVLGIINYSVAVVIAGALIAHERFSIPTTLLRPLFIITGSLVLGAALGSVFNAITAFIKKETEGVFIMVIFGLLAGCFGLATVIGVNELLAIMTMGVVVVNFNEKREKIFKVMERYVDELIFVLFFTLSGMHLDFSVLAATGPLLLCFILFRTVGKVSGTMLGAAIAGSSPSVRKYTAGGLIPQGGIVIGLALMMKQDPAFEAISDIMISLIIGSAVIHELVGPVLAKIMLKKAGEIETSGGS